MAQYYYVVDTGITTGGVSVGQSTYNLMIDEKFRHGIIPVPATIGLWEEIINDLAPDDLSLIHI